MRSNFKFKTEQNGERYISLSGTGSVEKDGWTITDDPYFLYYAGIKMEVDLGAERLMAANKNQERILVEIKSFIAQSKVYAWHGIVGQFENYVMALEQQDPNRELYLALPDLILDEFFETKFVQDSIKRHNMKILIYDTKENKIIKWIK